MKTYGLYSSSSLERRMNKMNNFEITEYGTCGRDQCSPYYIKFRLVLLFVVSLKIYFPIKMNLVVSVSNGKVGEITTMRLNTNMVNY